ncbi:MAG: Allophanate hydrolase [Herbaspirillum sp.]|nr:Allophanate hydrolase [Herbaspirillum sp.]
MKALKTVSPLNLSLPFLRRQYLDKTLTPRALIEQLLPFLEAPDSHHIWIHRLDRAALLSYAERLAAQDPAGLPLYGIPFAIKDNIDLAGAPTTAGCPAYAYAPAQHAAVVQRLIDAGAIPLGKTNLDQFATGLVGTRSPYGAARNALDPAYISGGSSSGSAVAVALGLASFSLGTDTAGSGRVPAMLNNLVGLKPTLGMLSNRGLVPACKTLDCISIFALTAADAADVLAVAAAYDAADAYSRSVPAVSALPLPFDEKAGADGFRFGVPAARDLEYFGNAFGPACFAAACDALRKLGGTPVEIDFTPFLQTARLLYEGPWVAERYAAIADFIEAQPEALFPVTRQIIGPARSIDAVAAFQAQYRLQALRREAAKAWQQCDLMITPTAGTTYTVEQVQNDPVRLNSNMGYYTNFVNLLDLSAVAVPAGFQQDGLPFGVTLFAQAFSEQRLLALAGRLHQQTSQTVGATGLALRAVSAVEERSKAALPAAESAYIDIAVCGAHMSGLPLNGQLTSRGAHLLKRTASAPVYRFYALPGDAPKRPGMVRSEHGGAAIELEVWRMPLAGYGAFVAAIAAPLGIGTVLLADGATVQGFLCEAIAAAGAGAIEITHLGSWRNYLN